MPTPLVNSFSDPLASPIVDVRIYPYYTGSSPNSVNANGVYFSTVDASQATGGLRAVEVRKSVLDANASTFTIELAPGGPKGVDDIQTWTSILTPMSLVQIGMRRGALKRIVMVGVITSIEETQSWGPDKAERTIRIQGMDFTYFFANFSMYQFTALGVLSAPPGIGAITPVIANQSGISGVDSPINIGLNLFRFMWGEISGPLPTPQILGILGQGLMSKTQINLNGNIIPVSNVLTLKFESLFTEVLGSPANGTVVPCLWAFTLGDGNWLGQFRDIFSDPWYEFYVMTAQTSDVFTRYDVGRPTGVYDFIPSSIPSTPSQITLAPGTIFSMPNYPDAVIYVIARTAPPPFVDQNGTLHSDDWNTLPIYQDNGFIRSTVAYDVAGHANMIFLLPEFMIAAFSGGGASNNAVAAEASGIAANIYGISKYGFRPVTASTKWFAGNITDLSTINSTQDLYQVQLQYLQMKVAGLYTPAPQQLSGEVVLPLRPDILPGNRFQYKPFKNDGLWLFYNPAVIHRWEFGREASTTLQVTRGLPLNLYNDDTKLTQLILGLMEIQYNSNANTLVDPSARYVLRSNTSVSSGGLPGMALIQLGGIPTSIPTPNTPGTT